MADEGEGSDEAHADAAPQEASGLSTERTERPGGQRSGAPAEEFSAEGRIPERAGGDAVGGDRADAEEAAGEETGGDGTDAQETAGEETGGDGTDAQETAREETGGEEAAAGVSASWPPGTDGHEPAPGPDGLDAGRDHDGDAAASGAAPDAPGEEGDRPGAAGVGREGGDDGTGGPGTASGAPSGAAPGPARVGMAGLSTGYRVVAGLVMVGIGLLACVHLGMVFLHVAPSNTLSKEHAESVNEWIYPEFEQNWKLFAPNPLQQNISVHVRVEVVSADGDRRTSRWMSLTAEDTDAIRSNPLPSHADQNELRRAWDFFVNSHDEKSRSTGMRGSLSEAYLRRIVMLRLDGHDYGGTVERIQLRSSSRRVAAPPWSTEKISTRPTYRELGWWNVSTDDLPGDSAAARAAATSGEEADQ
ncbi:DUF5819 family protein [Streptomyces sp. NPDC008125]|uniref:DUF5819 family protein n=1 Tax=Streptomyces sp. NPDC008125 TaxID=3364811 RepID=UPI0036E35ECD